MSREPQSAAHRSAYFLGRSGTPPPAPKPTPPKREKPKPGRGRNIKVKVEGLMTQRRERAVVKALTTTQALTADERALIREFRETSPEAAGIAVAKIKAAKEAKK